MVVDDLLETVLRHLFYRGSPTRYALPFFRDLCLLLAYHGSPLHNPRNLTLNLKGCILNLMCSTFH